MRIVQFSLMGPLVALLCLLPAPADAKWQMYVGGNLGYSITDAKVAGSAETNVPPDRFSGTDQDVSPLLGGFVGLEIPMIELTPWQLPNDMRLPRWPVRLEVEVVGVREYKLTTHGLIAAGPRSVPFHTTIRTWSLYQNLWLDVPLQGLHRPISAASGFLFKQRRLPWLKRTLKSATFYTGLGIGLSHHEIKSTDNVFKGKTKEYEFAYQIGAGLGYQLTDRVNLGVGYRYHRTEKMGMDLLDVSTPGRVGVSNDVHEVQFVVRVRVLDIPYPWRRMRR